MNIFTTWKDKVSQYVDVRYQLAKLNFIERTSHVLGMLIFTLVMLILGLAFLIFMGFSLMELFVIVLDGNRVGGALLTSLSFGILFALILLLRKSIINIFAGMFIKIMTELKDDDNDDIGSRVDVKNGDDL